VSGLKKEKTRGQVLQSNISRNIMGGVIIFGVIHKKVGPANYNPHAA